MKRSAFVFKRTAVRRGFTVTALAVVASLVSHLQAADPAISIFTSVGPSGSTSPNANAYFQNAITGIQQRDSNAGIPVSNGTGPAAYTTTTQVQTNQVIVSQGYNSWKGVADPGPIAATYGPAYSGEFGSMLYFGLDVRRFGSSTSQFSLSQINVGLFRDGAQVDSYDGTQFGANSFRLYTYNNGTDVSGGVTDVTATANANTKVDEIIYRGGALFFPSSPQPGDLNNQDTLNKDIDAINNYNGPGQTPTLTARYTVSGTTAANIVSVPLTPSAIVPEPGSMVAAIAGGLGLLMVSRKKLALRR
jgi:hypothetical protein